MRSWKLLALLAALTVLRPGPAAAQAPETKADLAANAALKYWEAFALMPVLDKDQEKLVSDWSKSALDEPARKVLAASEKSLLYLHRGARLRRCDWSLDYQDGMELLLPYLAKARDLARLAALHARHEFAQGHWDAGAEDVTAILALARHVGSDPMALCIMVRYVIERLAIDLVALHVQEAPALALKTVAAYEALPPGATLQQAYLGFEKSAVQWLVKRMREAEARQSGAWRDILKGAFSEPKSEDAIKQVGSYERALQQLEAIPALADQVAKLVGLPREEFAARYPEFKKKAKAENMLVGYILSAADQVLATEQRNQAQLAMLKAAAAVAQGGADQLKDIKDPFGNGPFEYRALDKGFELKSKLLFRDQPVTLTVGPVKKG
jgi:hypothetical protein